MTFDTPTRKREGARAWAEMIRYSLKCVNGGQRRGRRVGMGVRFNDQFGTPSEECNEDDYFSAQVQRTKIDHKIIPARQ